MSVKQVIVVSSFMSIIALQGAIVINAATPKNPISIGSERECFFDSHLLNAAKTTAELKVHQPVLQETVMVHDKPWEGDGCDYYNLFFDDAEAVSKLAGKPVYLEFRMMDADVYSMQFR